MPDRTPPLPSKGASDMTPSVVRVVYLNDAEREAVIWAVKRALRGVEAPPPPLMTLTATEAIVALAGALIELGGDADA